MRFDIKHILIKNNTIYTSNYKQRFAPNLMKNEQQEFFEPKDLFAWKLVWNFSVPTWSEHNGIYGN